MFGIFRNGPKQEIPEKETLTYWLETHWQKGNLCPPPISVEQFEKFLILYLLSKDYRTVLSMPDDQARTEILYDILVRHSEVYQREYKEHLRRNKKE